MHINTVKKIAFIAIAIGLFAFVSSAHALTYQFGQKLSGGGPDFANIATLDVTLVDHDVDGDFDDWFFELQIQDLSNFGTVAHIGGLAIEGTMPSLTTIENDNDLREVTAQPGLGPGGNNAFDFKFDTQPSGNPNEDLNRLTSGEFVSWYADNMGTTLPLDGFAALHIQSTNFNPDSVWYISPVPEPETYAMLLIGLGLVGFAAHRRRYNQNFA